MALWELDIDCGVTAFWLGVWGLEYYAHEIEARTVYG
jgi:hypothetical protein